MPGAVLHRAKMQQLRALVSDKWQQQQIEDTLKYNQWNKPPQITSGALGYEGRWKLGFYPSSLFTTFKALTRKLRQFPVGTTFDYTDDYASSPADNTHVRARLARWLNLRGYTLTDARRS